MYIEYIIMINSFGEFTFKKFYTAAAAVLLSL